MPRGFIIISLLLLVNPFQSFGQDITFVLSGRILDARSQRPIAAVSVKTRQQLAITNGKGEFRINAQVGDRLFISHIGYQAVFQEVKEVKLASVEVLLNERIMELSEVEVTAFISEGRFKSEVLLAVPKYEYENKLAFRNLQLIKQIAPLEFSHDLSSYDFLYKNAKSLGEVSFFSSNPSVGMLKALRQIGRKRTYKIPSYPQKLPAGSLRKFGNEQKEIESGFNPQ